MHDKREGRGKFSLGFAGEADDKIRRKSNILAGGAKTVDDAAIIIGGMFAVHGRQDPVGAGLHRKMHERHQRGEIAMGCDQRIIDITGMAGGVAQPHDTFDFGEMVQQPAQRPGPPVGAFTVIGVDVLANERDLAHAVVGESLHVVDDLRHRARDFRAARIGHDAEGAELVATFLHGDESGDAARADRVRFGGREKTELVLDREFGLQRTAFALRARQQLRQMMIALRPDHDVDDRRAADDLRTLGLRHAARHRDAHIAPVTCGFILGDPQPPEFGVDLLGSLLPDMAGVEDHQIGILGTGCLHKAFGSQRVHHALRIVDVHLAAIGLDMQLARRLHGTWGGGGMTPWRRLGLKYSLNGQKASVWAHQFGSIPAGASQAAPN